MSCKNCGAEKTIKAHLIPRVFCKQVQTGKSHAALIVKNGEFRISQSGVWDPDILCADCDGILGEYENYAHKVSSAIRDDGSDVPGKIKIVSNVETAKLLRFCSGILYKYSLTSKQNGRIDLGRYQDVLRRFVFDVSAVVPDELDAFLFRPLRYPQDDGLFAYRVPSPDRKFGVNIYRMMMGGILCFVKIDRRKLPDDGVQPLLIKGRLELPYLTTPVVGLEEFEMARESFNNNQRLSDFLDKNP